MKLLLKKGVGILSGVVTFVLILSLVALFSYTLVDYFSSSESAVSEDYDVSSGGLLRAALIDALYVTHPNVNFTRSLEETLGGLGFQVDVYQGEEVTVEFLKKLVSGYSLIVLRMHSALSSRNELYLFTSEPYSSGKYVYEQSYGLAKKAFATDPSQSVFAVNWGFIKKLMTGKFDGALVIAMGCDGALDPFIAQEFLNQGAVGYIAWNGPVLLAHSDETILHLVRALYIERLSMEEAVSKINYEIGEDPHWGTFLDCYIP